NFNIDKSLENMSERNSSQAVQYQQLTMTAMNNLALILSDALEQLQNAQQNARSGGKGKGKPSLSSLRKMQEELSKNMQQAREQLQKQGQQRLSRQQQQAVSEQFAKLAREQQLIRQAMQELNRLENKDGRNRLGNLEEMVKEMEQTEKDLVNKRIVRETIE